MFERLRQDWDDFARAQPGTRFERRYRRKRRDAVSLFGRAAWIGVGVLASIAGFIMLFTPGPGLLAMAFGATCFAQESLGFARRCDRAELRIRAAIERWRERRRS